MKSIRMYKECLLCTVGCILTVSIRGLLHFMHEGSLARVL